MASVYVKKSSNIIYISWWDYFENKTKNKSTKMHYSAQNMKKANEIAKKLQKEMDRKKEEAVQIGIRRGTTIQAAFEHFKRNKSHMNKKTIWEYDRFFKLLTGKFPPESSCQVLNKLSVEEWLSEIKRLPYKPNTVYTYSKQMLNFLNFLFEYNYIPMFLVNSEVMPKPEVNEIIVFSDDDLKKVLSSLQKKNSNFRTMVYLACYTGLRSSDLLGLTVERTDLNNREIKFYSPKRDTYLTQPVHEELLPILKNRIDEVKTGKLILYANYENMTKAFRRFMESIGLKGKGYSLRTFRKSFVTRAARSGMKLELVSSLVGHSNITTTSRYYRQVATEDKKEELKKLKIPKLDAGVPEEKSKKTITINTTTIKDNKKENHGNKGE